MIDISFLLVSLEDYRPQVNKILSIQTNYSYEIVVCSDHLYKEYNNTPVVFIEDEEQNGSCSAFNKAYKNSSGQYLITLTGVVLPPDNIYELVGELQKQEEDNCKLVVTSMSCSTGTVCPIPIGFPGRRRISDYEFGILRWPAFSKKTVEKYLGGNIWPQEFKHHYMDNWLASYCYLMGEPKKSLKNVRTEDVDHQSKTKLDDYDLKVYKDLCYINKKRKNENIDIMYSLVE